jgi:ubiquinone/menaquinone biosynthesis C-methylase UbiE
MDGRAYAGPRHPMSPHDLGPDERERRNEVVRRSWAERAPRYDKSVQFGERRILGSEHRGWACSRATGATLEVAVGTGLNLPLYPSNVALTGIDLSPEMLALARSRATSMHREIELREGDAHDLPFDNGSFDSVVCTYSLCNIPDPRLAVAEMKRILRSDGRLILVDHIRSSVMPILWLQRAMEVFSRRQEEFMTRRPLEYVLAEGLDVVERDRLRAGVVERLVAIKTDDHPDSAST